MSKKAFVDLGHGGNDPGACGNGLRESDIVLAVGLRVKYHLLRHDVEVMLSRESDKTVSLAERTNMANRFGADALASIHCNAAIETAYGIETYCYTFKYRVLADKVHGKLVENKSLYYANRGVKEADFHMLRESNMDAALVEMAFISNARDAQLLRNMQEEYAIAIAQGILDYLGIAWINENESKPENNELYRVRKSWGDAASQKGAYSIKENAIAECKNHNGYNVYDSKGNCVYSNGGSQPSQPTPTKEKIDLFSRVAVKGRGSKYYDWVKNLTDYTGDKKNPCCLFMAYPSKGEVRFRVSPISEGRYYSEVQNYYSSKGIYDEAGLPNVPFDKIQMRFDLPGYKIRYRAMCNGCWLDWVENGNSYMEGHNGYAGLGDGTPITAIECEIVTR
ncbi:N-acetylmuramoyl-L-alanine amidase family protein [Clostridium culturomicium]|uniref:N-acetylmuramoyl-L-alanine amidase family protein n=1 Tax=Clostridium culturomicium TaxID=1499683 RepID=UPI0038576CA0